MIFKKCIMTITNNTAKLDEDTYLYRLDKKCEPIKYSFKNNF